MQQLRALSHAALPARASCQLHTSAHTQRDNELCPCSFSPHTNTTYPPYPPPFQQPTSLRSCPRFVYVSLSACVSVLVRACLLRLPLHLSERRALSACARSATASATRSSTHTLSLSLSLRTACLLSVCLGLACFELSVAFFVFFFCVALRCASLLPLLLLLIADASRGAGSVYGSGRPVELSQRSRAAVALSLCLTVLLSRCRC